MKTIRGILLVLAALVLAACVAAPPPPTATPPPATVTPSAGLPLTVAFLDVGQGDATLIRSPGGRTMLIDGGNSSQDADQVIIPALQRWGSQRLDIMVATHPDQDHIGGLERVIEAMPVGQMVLTGQVHTTKTYEQLLTAIRDKKLAAVRARAGTRLDLDLLLTAAILGPTDEQVNSNDTNNASIVIRLSYGAIGFLFIGDAEEAEESTILRSGADVHAQILKLGHHGSRTSTSQEWLQAVSPQVGVISVGADNRYGHPQPETLDLLARDRIKVYRTDQQGTITVVSDGSGYQVTTERR